MRHTLPRTSTLGEPKTKRSHRTVVLAPLAAEPLREHRRLQLEQRLRAGRRWQDLGHVFTTRHGTPLASRNVNHWYGEALTAAGLPHQRFHDARHAAATMMLASGVPPHEVSWTLGHASVSITADVYGHQTAASQERAARAIDKVLAR